MKHLVALLTLLLFVTIPSVTQTNQKEDEEQSIKKKDVPKEILTAFEKSYPKAKVNGYSKESDEGTTVYEIESKEGKTNRDISYTANGNVVSIEETIQYNELPEAIQNTLMKKYPKYKPTACEKITKGSTTQFEVLLKSGKKKNEVVLDTDGKIVKEEKKSKN